MATRAVIITIDNRIMTSTYNHYDGYPDYLGKALSTHYNSDELAKKISGEGYISYIDDETGEINVSNPRDKEVKPTVSDFGGMDVDDMAYELAKDINAAGADYAYIWNQRGDNWVTVKNDGIKSTMNKLADELPTMGFDDEQDMMEEKDYMTEWKSFLNEESFDQAFDRIDKEKEVYPGKYPIEKIMSQAMFRLQDEPKEMLDAYKKSLANDIRLNGKETYADYSVEDFIEDYENYVGDKMDS
jgi:hypothetical protein